MRRAVLVISLAALILVALPVVNYAIDESAQVLKLYLGEAKTISVSNPTRIAIANPSVIDVTEASKEYITVAAKSAGKTTLMIWDSLGEQSYMVKVFTEDIQDVKMRADNLLKRVSLPEIHTQADEDEGQVYLLGKVKTQADKDKLNLVLAPVKDKLVDLIEVREEEASIQIEAQLLELSRDALTTLGFTWPGSLTVTENDAMGYVRPFKQMLALRGLQRDDFIWQLDFLAQEGKAHILSRPSLVCQSGKEAEMLVGGEKPLLTTNVVSGGGSSTDVEYKEYGIKMKIKPTIIDDNRIKLVLNIEISEVGTAETIGGYTAGNATTVTARAYPLTKRHISTEVVVNNTQTLALGGLIKQKDEESIRKTPGLGDIPVLGWLFKKKTSTAGGGTGERGNMELFITLTPTILQQIQESAQKEKEVKIELKPQALPAVYIGAPSNPLEAYARVIQNRIMENLVYPKIAKDGGFQGTVKLNLQFSYEGKLLEAKIKESSGYKILDDNALNIAKNISSYPPFPASIDQKELWIEIPIIYRLD